MAHAPLRAHLRRALRRCSDSDRPAAPPGVGGKGGRGKGGTPTPGASAHLNGVPCKSGLHRCVRGGHAAPPATSASGADAVFAFHPSLGA